MREKLQFIGTVISGKFNLYRIKLEENQNYLKNFEVEVITLMVQYERQILKFN